MENMSVLALSLHEQLLQLKKQMGAMLFSIAEILKKIKDGELYIPLGYDNFAEYVQSPDVGLNQRTAYYYIEIYETYIEKLKYKPEELTEYSYDKLRKLIPIVNGECKVREVMSNALSLRWSDFAKQYKDEQANSGHSDYLPAPEFYRCSDCSKWVISVPLSECCEDYLKALYQSLKLRLDNGQKGVKI